MEHNHAKRREPAEPHAYPIIVVEDDEDTREVLCLLLTSAGYEAHQAASGPEALQLMRDMGDAPNLALIDIVMPGMSGYDVIRAMRRTPKLALVPVIVISGGPRPVGEDARVDVSGWLEKPSSITELLDRVGSILRSDPPASPRSSQPSSGDESADIRRRT